MRTNPLSLLLSITTAMMIVTGIIFATSIYTSSGSNTAKAISKLFSRAPSGGELNKTNSSAAATTTTSTQLLANQTSGPKSNATAGTAATILVNVDACDPKSQNPLSPKSVTIQVGGIVNWTNNDKLTHRFISGAPNAVTNLFDSGLVDPGKTAGVTLRNPGTFNYFDSVCSNNLNGTINVVPSSQVQQHAVTPKPLNSTLPRQLIVSPSQIPNATVSVPQINSTSPKPLPQPVSQRPNATLSVNITGQPASQKPAAIIPRQPPLQQQAYNQGFSSRGMINSLINTPAATWIATGNWTMNVDNGTMTFFGTNMTWYNNNGATSHTHEFQNFKPTLPAKVISFPKGVNSISFKGIMDVGTNHRIVWKNIPTTININGEKTITISVADNATNHHFAGQPIFGLVSSLVPCSDIPGPNMQVLPPCTNQHK